MYFPYYTTSFGFRYIQTKRLQGDIEAVSKKLRKVELFLTAFRNDPTKKAEVEKMIDAVFAAVEKKDAGALKSSYNDLVTKSQIKKLINPGYPVPKGSRIIDTSRPQEDGTLVVRRHLFLSTANIRILTNLGNLAYKYTNSL